MDELKTEWSLSEGDNRVDEVMVKHRDAEWGRPPNNQEGLKERQIRKRDKGSKNLTKSFEVRRSTRKRRLTEKELGTEHQRYIRMAENRRRTIDERVRTSKKGKKRAVNLVLTDQ